MVGLCGPSAALPAAAAGPPPALAPLPAHAALGRHHPGSAGLSPEGAENIPYCIIWRKGELWWLIGSAPDFWGIGPGFEFGICRKFQGREGNLPLMQKDLSHSHSHT